MAKIRIHNQRLGRQSNSGPSWISYSDMMAALLLVFVLILCYSLYHYMTVLEAKSAELDLQTAAVNALQISLNEKETELDEKSAQLIILQTDLENREEELRLAKEDLEAQQQAIIIIQGQLDEKQAELDAATIALNAQQAQLDAQALRIDALVGVRSRIISELTGALNRASLRAKVDADTGDILLDSAVFFETGSYAIKPDGQAMLDAFIPVYLSVLMQPEYADYLGQIVIEGHTDTQGSYLSNLELSQDRALAVAKYVLQMPGLSAEQQARLREILTATGRSYSDPVKREDGSVDMDASRRVEFKFTLRDAEMIEEMNRLLSGTDEAE